MIYSQWGGKMLYPNFDYTREPDPDKAFLLCQIIMIVAIIVAFSVWFMFAEKV